MERIRCRMEERDVDLLLLEELLVSQSFREWFLRKVGLDRPMDLVGGGRSIATANGESDIEIELQDDDGSVHLLVENKITATFQETQPQRYRDRGETRLASGICSTYRTVLVAPAAYLETARQRADAAAFDALIAYEDIINWLESAGSPRDRVRAHLLRSAVTAVRGRRMFDPGVTTFHLQYWELQQEVAPELGLKRPDVRGGSSTFIVLRPDRFQEQRRQGLCEFHHKVEKGFLDFELRGRGPMRKQFLEKHGSMLPPWISAERASRSLALRVHTTRIDVNRPFHEQEDAVREALEKAMRLVALLEEHPDLVLFDVPV